MQDLLPTHNQERRETPAFGLESLELELDTLFADGESDSAPVRVARNLPGKTTEIAQPIVLHRLACLSTLAVSPLGAQLTHLVLRLPRRNLTTALTSAAAPSLPQLVHLDLSTTHIVADARVPLLLRLHPKLEYLVLDRCSGLIGSREADTPPAILTVRWLGTSHQSSFPHD